MPLSTGIRSTGSVCAGWNSTQHVYLSVPGLPATPAIQFHPFTIASAAPDPPHKEFVDLDILIRAHDGFTRQMLLWADTHSTGVVRLDGPYGSSHAVDMIAGKRTSVVVAAGTGVAVAIPLLHELVRRRNKDLEAGRVAQSQQRFVLVLVVRSALIQRFLCNEYLQPLQRQGVRLILPPPTEEVGKPDIEATLLDVFRASSSSFCRPPQDSIGVVCSAPDSMNRSVRNFGARQAWHGRDVDIAAEKFGW